MVRRMGRSSTKIENNFIYKILFIRSKWLRRLVKLIFAILFIIWPKWLERVIPAMNDVEPLR
jgi:flagellar biogenesis protein FliO